MPEVDELLEKLHHHGGDIAQALAAGTERVALRRREAGLAEKS